MKEKTAFWGISLILLATVSCSYLIKPWEGTETIRWEKVPEADWPEIADDLDRDSLEQALLQSLSYLENQPSERAFPLGSGEISVRDLRESLLFLQEIFKNSPDPGTFRQAIKKRFHLYRPIRADGPIPVLLTGYYEPTLNGSRLPDSRFRYPVYRLPDDLLTVDLGLFSPKYQGQKLIARLEDHRLLPYYSRREIDQEGCLAGKNLEILWVDDLVKLFFLHIQGSGRVRLEDGTLVRLGYHGTNGRPYVPVGKELIRRGVIRAEDLSLQSIYAYLRDHPEEQGPILQLNPSYVFFREVEGGPFGSLGRPLTAGRSVAADQNIYPPTAPAWLQGWKPLWNDRGEIHSWVPFGRWVFVQDSGGAIKGPSRVDLFTGHGEEAEAMAGRLRHPGAFWLLLKKEIAISF